MKIGYLMQAGVPDVRARPYSGPAVHVRQVIKELKNLGHEVYLLALLDGQIWRSDDLQRFEPVCVRWLDRGPLRRFESVVRRIQYDFKLPYAAWFESYRYAQACRQELSGCELFYERLGWMGYGGGLAAHWLKIPLILEVNGDHLTELEMLGLAPRGMQRWLSMQLMSRAVRRANVIIATGEGWRQRFVDRWPVEPSHVAVIENGSEIVDLLPREQLRSFLAQPDPLGAVSILYIGAFEPWHGIVVLLRSIAKLVALGTPIRLTLAGSGSELSEIKQLVRELDLGNHVTLAGQLTVPDLAICLANADIGVSPYCGRVEYSGLKLLDYKAAGLATIASGENGEPAILDHGRTGWIVPPCDEDALCQAIVQLAADAELRWQIGREARMEAERQHSWRHTARQLDRLFTTVVSS